MAIIPQSLQARRPQQVQTLSQYQMQKVGVPQPASQPLQEIPEQSTSEQAQAIKEANAKINALNLAISVVFSGKGVTSSRLDRFPEARKFIDAIQWGNTAGMSGQEAQIIQRLHTELQGGYYAKSTGLLKPSESDILKNLYSAQTGQLEGIPTTTKAEKTQTVYYGDKVYKNVPVDVAKQALKNPNALRDLSYSTKSQPSKVITPMKTISPTSGLFTQQQGTNVFGKQVGTYNVETQVYTSPTGVQTTTTKPPIQAVKVGGFYDLSKKITDKVNVETQRYQELGYNKQDASTMAVESVRKGGMTYSQLPKRNGIQQEPIRLFGMTGSVITKEGVSEAARKRIAEQKTKIIVDDSSFYDEYGSAGYYNSSENAIHLSKKYADKQKGVVEHEEAHAFDFFGLFKSDKSFEEASMGGVDEEYYKDYYSKRNASYDKEIEKERKANAFELFASVPGFFGKLFPEESDVFKTGLNVSESKTPFENVQGVSTKKEEGFFGQLTSLGKTIGEGVSSLFGGGMTGNVVSEGSKGKEVKDSKKYELNNILGLKESEIYNPKTNTYSSTPFKSEQGTIFLRPLTIEEQGKVNLLKQKEKTIEKAILYPFGTAGQMFGGIFTTPLTEKEKESISGKDFFNPVKQYEIYSNYQDWKSSLKEGLDVSNKLKNLNNEYSKVEEEYKNKKINEIEYQKRFNEYSSKFDYYNKNENYQKIVNTDRKTLYQDIANSNLSTKRKVILSGLVSATDVVTYVFPQTRVIRGTGQLSSGLSELGYATSTEEKISAGGNILFGGLVAVSSFSKGGGKIFDVGLTGAKAKVVSKVASYGLSAGVSGLYGSEQYQETGSIPVAIGSGVGSFISLQVPFRKITSSLKETKLSDIKSNIKKLALDKRGTYGSQQQMEEVSADEEVIYDYVEQVWKKKNKITGKISRLEATTAFKTLPEEEQLNVLKIAFSESKDASGNLLKRIYLDKSSLMKDIDKAKIFMKESGLTNIQINKLIQRLFPNIEVTIPIIQSEGVMQEEANKISSIPQQVQAVKEVSKNRFNLLTGNVIQEKELQAMSQNKVVLFNLDRVSQKEKLIQKQGYKEEQQTKQESRQLSSLASLFNQTYQTKQIEKEEQISRTIPIQISPQIQKPNQVQRQERIIPILFKQPRPRTPDIVKQKEPINIVPFGFIPSTKKPEQEREQVFIGYALQDTKKGKGKWIPVTKPSTKQGAIDRASQYVDRTISARWKVEPMKKKIRGKEQFVRVEKQKLQQPTGYWERNQNKFRTFQQKKGVRTQLPNGGIELQKFRLDSSGETRKIQKEKARASNTRNFFGFR
jgi:hypothetical protein